MTISVAEETNTFSAGNNRACSNRRSEENKYNDSERVRTGYGGSSQIGPLYNRGGLGKKLLYLWRIWAYGLPLQK